MSVRPSMHLKGISRRRCMATIAAGGLLAGVLAACGVPTATPPTVAPAKPTGAQSTSAPATASSPVGTPASAIATAAASGAMGAAATPVASPATAPSTINWQQHKGQSVHFIWTNSIPDVGGILPYWGEFEKLTGIKLQYEGLATNQQRQKISIALVAKDPSLDGFGMQVSQQGRQFFESGWIDPLDKYISNQGLTDAGWDLDDFGEGSRAASSIASPGAKPNTVIPSTAQCQVLYYRTDLFKEAGLKPPTTTDEMKQAAKALHKPEKQQYGITMRGLGHDATTQIGTYLYGLGGRWVGDDGRLAIDTPEMAKTLELYGGLLHDYGPPGAINITGDQNSGIFQQGQAAMMSELNSWKVILNDPAKSPKVAGKVGVIYIPRGPVAGPVPGGHFIMLPVQNVAISAFSKHKDATWYFVQWLTNKQNFVRRQLGGSSSPRLSTWSDKQFLDTEAAKANPDWIAVSTGGIKYGRNWVSPPILAVNQFRDVFGKAITAAIQGQSIPAALKAAQTELDALVKRTEPPGHKLVDQSKLPV